MSNGVLWEGKFLRIVRKSQWEYVERTNCTDIVAMISITENKEIIFVEQFRIPLGKKVIELPAGLVNDQGQRIPETLENAARRELLEETGYMAHEFKVVSSGPPSAGLTSEMITFMLVPNCRKIASGGGDKTENIATHLVTIDEADHWLEQRVKVGFLIDPKVYTGLYFLRKHLTAAH